MKKRRSLNTQIVTTLVIITLIPILIMSGFNFWELRKNSNENFNELALSNMNRVSDAIDQLNYNSKQSLDMLASNNHMLNLLKDKNGEQELLVVLNNFAQSHKDVACAYIGVSDGRLIQSPDLPLPPGYDPRTRDWYKAAVEKDGEVVITDPYEDVSQNVFVITYAKTVKDKASGKIIGVAALDINITQVTNLISGIKLGNSGFVALMDGNGNVISHKNKEYINKTPKDAAWIKDVYTSNLIGKNESLKGGNYLTYSISNKETNWKIAGFIPKSEFDSKVNGTLIITAILLVLMLILSILIGVIVSKSITNPIKKLENILKKVRDGDFTEKAVNDKRLSYEVSNMVESINLTIENISDIIKNVAEGSGQINEASESLVAVTEQSNAAGDEVAKAVQEIADGASLQASSLQESAEATNKLSSYVETSINDSKNMIIASQDVKKSTEEGTSAIASLKDSFDETTKANQILGEHIKKLAVNSMKVSSITETISAITSQTNLLALNASIEAARAGEAGRGFAVVAEEVRKLAEESAKSAEEINNVMKEIKNSVSDVEKNINYANDLNEKTMEGVKNTNLTFEKITDSMSILEKAINNVGELLDKIKESKDVLAQKIADVDAVAQQTAATSQEVSASSEEQSAGLQEIVSSAERLNGLADNLRQLINKFKI